MEHTFKISPNWDCSLSFDKLVEDARFVFVHSGHKGRRPHIVLRTPISGFDVIEIDYDRYGLITNAISKFSNWSPELLQDYSKEIKPFIAHFLKVDGACELITP